ncbi:MAG: hypothetical protein JWL77_4719 [Chthonomonadaceae bacterium]|nr:hypothetical protein [Chthonomonadaceae bacterium]
MLGLSDLFVDELYIAGQRVPAGLYREIGTGREVQLEEEGVLPASLNGRIATYICVRYTWHEHQTIHAPRPVHV